MSSVGHKRYEALKYIAGNPQCDSKISGLDGYIVEDLLINKMVNGYKSNELGSGPEPVIYSLQILPKGTEFLETYSKFGRLGKFLKSNWIVTIFGGLTVLVVGHYLIEYLKNL